MTLNSFATGLTALAALGVTPAVGMGQEVTGASDGQAAITVSPGYFTGYRGKMTYLVSALFARPSGVPVEVAFEFIPAATFAGDARILWLGVQHPRGLPAHGPYTGMRGGYLDGPSYDGVLVDLHVGLQLGWRSFGIRLEPALVAGVDEVLFLGGRFAAGLTWTFTL